MPSEIGLWRVDAGEPIRVLPAPMPLESELEQLIEADPTILGEPLLFIGRQVPTAYGKFIDLLAVNAEGDLRMLELKRDKTPRDVVAQALDYGSWIETLGYEGVVGIFEAYKPGEVFDQAFADRFGSDLPTELNGSHSLTIVASAVDSASARIVEYLSRFDVPINVMFFRYFADGDRRYIGRTWLVDERQTNNTTKGSAKASKQPWNGVDWYVSFGVESERRSWEDARRYGFVSAGGGTWYSKTIRSLPVGARVFVCIPRTGYVGVGTVTGPAAAFDDAVLTVSGSDTKLSALSLEGHYSHEPDEAEDTAEYVVPVEWITTLPAEEAVWKKGFFANQNSACKLRNKFTLEELARSFGVDT